MEKVRTGVIGLGCRGLSVLKWLLLEMDNVEVTAVCDKYHDRTLAGMEAVKEKYGREPFYSDDWRELIDKDKVDALLILSSWETHVPMAIAAMEAGIPVAVEVGGAYSLDQCWQLVHTYESTRTPFMFLENCCYGQVEMAVLNMVKLGIFGDVMHCTGGYCHDLRYEVSHGKENRHYRLENYLNRNCENYPTHELGPIAKILNINHGNRMVSLVSMASASRGINDYAARTEDVDPVLINARFAQGDVVTTLIKCAGGQTISLTLDTTLPRPYSRIFTVKGTRALYTEDNHSFYVDDDFTEADHFNWQKNWNNAGKYIEKYQHPVWADYLKNGIRGGHGGMDGLVYNEFIECVRTGRPCPIDVYDAAAWMAITPLSEKSIALGSAPVEIPDFTGGGWCIPGKK